MRQGGTARHVGAFSSVPKGRQYRGSGQRLMDRRGTRERVLHPATKSAVGRWLSEIEQMGPAAAVAGAEPDHWQRAARHATHHISPAAFPALRVHGVPDRYPVGHCAQVVDVPPQLLGGRTMSGYPCRQATWAVRTADVHVVSRHDSQVPQGADADGPLTGRRQQQCIGAGLAGEQDCRVAVPRSAATPRRRFTAGS